MPRKATGARTPSPKKSPKRAVSPASARSRDAQLFFDDTHPVLLMIFYLQFPSAIVVDCFAVS